MGMGIWIGSWDLISPRLMGWMDWKNLKGSHSSTCLKRNASSRPRWKFHTRPVPTTGFIIGNTPSHKLFRIWTEPPAGKMRIFYSVSQLVVDIGIDRAFENRTTSFLWYLVILIITYIIWNQIFLLCTTQPTQENHGFLHPRTLSYLWIGNSSNTLSCLPYFYDTPPIRDGMAGRSWVEWMDE